MDSAQSGWYSGPAAGVLAGQVQVITVVKNGTSGASYVNGVSQGTDSVSATFLNPVAALAVGTRTSGLYGYSGQIAEILVYNRALTDTERQLIEADLESRYINPDSDANGLPDAWEVRYLGHSGNDASSDPGAAGGFAVRQKGDNANQYVLSWPRAADQTLQGESAVVATVDSQLQLLTFTKGGISQSGYRCRDTAVGADGQFVRGVEYSTTCFLPVRGQLFNHRVLRGCATGSQRSGEMAGNVCSK